MAKLVYRHKSIWNALIPLSLALMLVACLPTAPDDDEGNASFAREVIPTLLGRRATGVDEVKVVADIAQLQGRDVAIRMLMEDEDYVDHWADALVDILKIKRYEARGSVHAAQDETCWGDAAYAIPDPSIALWVRDHDPKERGGPTGWNMTDLLRSAIVIDDLSVIYKANLFPLVIRRKGENGVKDETLTEYLLNVYLNRDATCLQCHNPNYSASNLQDESGNMVWQRLFNFRAHPERALFKNYRNKETFNKISPLMRRSVHRLAEEDERLKINPWGMHVSCVTDKHPLVRAPLATGFKAVTDGAGGNVRFASLDGRDNANVSLWELERALDRGVRDLEDGYDRIAPQVLEQGEKVYCDAVKVFETKCNHCHSGAEPEGDLDLSSKPYETLREGRTNRWQRFEDYIDDVNPGRYSRMPPRPDPALTLEETRTIDAWIDADGIGFDDDEINKCDRIPRAAPDEALAYLIASNAVDGIWEAVMGYRLTLDHGFPRNKEQRDMLWHLTESTFLQQDWSLKAVLTKVLSSNWFARRAPSISEQESPYHLPPIFDPWIVASPVDNPEPAAIEQFNGKGEQVNRYRVNTLLRSIAGALGWNEPRRFRGRGYPAGPNEQTAGIDEALGQYKGSAVPGFKAINFQALLALEAKVGLCDKDSKSVSADDWIDELVANAKQFNRDHADTPVTIGDTYSILKDRLIQDTSIQTELPEFIRDETGEWDPEIGRDPDIIGLLGHDRLDAVSPAELERLRQFLIAKLEGPVVAELFKKGTGLQLTLDSSISSLSDEVLEKKLRESCGALVKTPQFLLANISPRGYMDNNIPEPPRLNVCLDGESCGYSNICRFWSSKLSRVGNYVICSENRTLRNFTRDDFVTGLDPFSRSSVNARRSSGIGGNYDNALEVQTMRERLEFDFSFKERSKSICPDGMCQFVRRPSVGQCLTKPDTQSCRRLLATCDPRGGRNAIDCAEVNDLRVDGVHVLWADGARVSEAVGVKIMRPDLDQRYSSTGGSKLKRKVAKLDKVNSINFQHKLIGPFSGKDLKWKELKKGTRLRAGDLIDIPLKAQLTLKYDKKVFTTGESIGTSLKGRAENHVLSITGPSMAKLQAVPFKQDVLTVAELRESVINGEYGSKAPTKSRWLWMQRLSVNPDHVSMPSLKENYERKKAYEELHIMNDPRYTPDGADRELEYNKEKGSLEK